MNKDIIQIMKLPFENIKRMDGQGKPYWTSRELCDALGYSSYQRFSNLLNKSIEIANSKGMKTDDHFNLHVEMVKLGSGAFRNVENFHLSQMACLIIAENADGKKPQVKQAREYYANSISTIELVENHINSNVILYKTNHGEVRVEVIGFVRGGCYYHKLLSPEYL